MYLLTKCKKRAKKRKKKKIYIFNQINLLEEYFSYFF